MDAVIGKQEREALQTKIQELEAHIKMLQAALEIAIGKVKSYENMVRSRVLN